MSRIYVLQQMTCIHRSIRLRDAREHCCIQVPSFGHAIRYSPNSPACKSRAARSTKTIFVRPGFYRLMKKDRVSERDLQ